MRVIIMVSSKNIWVNLCKINFNIEWVIQLNFRDDIMEIQTNMQLIEIPIHYSSFSDKPKNLIHKNRRWDWLKLLVSQVSEQPITLNISEENLRISFEY